LDLENETERLNSNTLRNVAVPINSNTLTNDAVPVNSNNTLTNVAVLLKNNTLTPRAQNWKEGGCKKAQKLKKERGRVWGVGLLFRGRRCGN